MRQPHLLTRLGIATAMAMAPQIASACRAPVNTAGRIADFYDDTLNPARSNFERVVVVRIVDAANMQPEAANRPFGWAVTAVVERTTFGNPLLGKIGFISGPRNMCEAGPTDAPAKGRRWVLYYMGGPNNASSELIYAFPIEQALSLDPKLGATLAAKPT